MNDVHCSSVCSSGEIERTAFVSRVDQNCGMNYPGEYREIARNEWTLVP